MDGGKRTTPSVRARLGNSFDDDPVHRRQGIQPPLPSHTSHTTQSEPADPCHDLLAELQAPLPRESPSTSLPHTPAVPNSPAPIVSAPQESTNLHNQILAAIRQHPEIIRFYLSQCATNAAKRGADSEIGPRPTRPRLTASSDTVLDAETTDRHRHKHVFHPTRVQQAVHNTIVSDRHQGKSPGEVMDVMISSRSTRFQPHPAILSHLYDFQFGRRGLSIMHFQRFDFGARRQWNKNAQVNLNNFSPSVNLPKPPTPQHLDDLSSALRVLHTFAEEFTDDTTRRLISTAQEFVEDIRSYSLWTGADIETLAFWFDEVFEDYRRAIEHDIHDGTDTRTSVRSQFSFQDPQLQGVLYAIQSERLAMLHAVPQVQRPHAPPGPRPRDQHRRQDQPRANTIPREVLDALPRQGSRSLCMRFLSNAGCFSRQADRCTSSQRAHFVPSTIPPCVRNYIMDHMGGLRSGMFD